MFNKSGTGSTWRTGSASIFKKSEKKELEKTKKELFKQISDEISHISEGMGGKHNQLIKDTVANHIVHVFD